LPLALLPILLSERAYVADLDPSPPSPLSQEYLLVKDSEILAKISE
jgi:hypothetical protein